MTRSSPIKALSLLIPGSALVALVGIASAKVWALLLGAAGYGLMGVLQNTVTLIAMVAELGMAAAVVKHGAPLIANEQTTSAGRIWLSAARITWPLGITIAAMMMVFAKPLGTAVLGTPDLNLHIWWCVPAVLATVAANLRTGILNAHHRIGALAKQQVAGAVIAASVSVLLIGAWKIEVLGMAIAGAAMARWAISVWYLRRETGIFLLLPWSCKSSPETKLLLSFGVSFTLSTLATAGVQAAIPILIRPTLGGESVGYYQAAYNISVGSLGFLLTAMAQDYYPRIAGTAGTQGDTLDILNRQHRLVMLIGVPVILTIKALAPTVVLLLFSREFLPAVAVLEWQLVGDILKFSSWTFSFIILAKTTGRTFFVMELVGGGALLAGILGGAHFFGLTGLGIGFLAAYVVYWLATRMVLSKKVTGGKVLNTRNSIALVLALTLALLPEGIALVGFPAWKAVAAIAAAVASCLFCGWHLVREFRGATKSKI